MNHRIVSAVVWLLVALFIGAALLFAWANNVRAPEGSASVGAPDIPHPPEQRDRDCGECHVISQGTLPATHRSFQQDTCDACHEPTTKVLIPHSIAMGETGCPTCHGDPQRDLGVPESHVRYKPGQCLLCHPIDGDKVDVDPVSAGIARSPAPRINHETSGIFENCEDCHQLTGRFAMPSNHAWLEESTCLQCHESVAAR